MLVIILRLSRGFDILVVISNKTPVIPFMMSGTTMHRPSSSMAPVVTSPTLVLSPPIYLLTNWNVSSMSSLDLFSFSGTFFP